MAGYHLFIGSGICPECGVPLRRSGFRQQLFEDPCVDKEVAIRRKILKEYNKRQEDFATLREYNDYLVLDLVDNDILSFNHHSMKTIHYFFFITKYRKK